MKAALSLIYQQLLKQIPLDHTRFLFDQFHLKDRLTGLVGPRGSGKTTLLLQYIKQHLPVDETFYFSADHIYFTQITLYEFVMQLHLEDGVQTVFIDEIHKYKQWNQELKNVYDSFPKLTIAFSGSSSLDLVKGSYDLSRRAKLFRLPGMSFREYVQLTSKTSYPILTWDELLQSPQKACERIGDVPRVMSHFKDYLRHGFYPFYYEQPLSYYEKLLAVLDKTIFEDIAEFYHLKTPHLSLLRKLVAYLATVPPGTVSTHNLAKNMQVDDKTVLGFLTQLQETGLVRMVYPAEPGRAQLTRPAKIFLSNVRACPQTDFSSLSTK